MSVNYTIKSGDTLSGIAKKFGTTVSAIAAANKTIIKNVNVIHTGDVITIPGATPSEPAKDYAAIGQQVEKCVAAIAELPEFKALEKML